MKICLRCGVTTKDDVDYCPSCGRPVYKEQVAQAPLPEPARDAAKEVGSVEVKPEVKEDVSEHL